MKAKTLLKTRVYNAFRLAITLTLVLSVVLFSGCSEKRALKEVVNYINDYSVIVEEVSYDEIISIGVSGVLAQDKYAKYYSKAEYELDKQQDDGKYSGFGLNFIVGTNEIFSVVYNSPAERAGIKAGDVIKTITYNNFVYEIQDYEDVSRALSSVKTGEQAIFCIEREIPDGLEELTLTLTKEEFKAGYVLYQDNEKELRVRTDEDGDFYLKEFLENKNALLPDGVAYIKFTEFNGDAPYQLEQALNYAKANEKNKLILDLRSNGGGRLDILQEVCAILLPKTAKKGDLLVNAHLKNGSKDYCLKAQGENDYILDMVVLANSNTASASEALIGALNYYGAGGFSLDKLVCEYNGKRDDFSTYGKGVMQTTFSLSFGGAIKLTTATIYQPDRKTCIQGVGIAPSVSQNEIRGNDRSKALTRAVQILAS